MSSCRGFRAPVVAAVASVIVFAQAVAGSWSQAGEATLAPFQVMSTLNPSYSLLSADSATATDGAYETSDDGVVSLASVTSGQWDTSAGPLVLGGATTEEGGSLGPYVVRLSGSGTTLKTAELKANYGIGRLELLNGVEAEFCGNVNLAQSGASGKCFSTQTVVVVNSTFKLNSAQLFFGYRNTSYPNSRGYGFLYATNSTFTSVDGAVLPYCYFKNGKYVFKNCSFAGCNKDYGFNVQIGANVIIDGSTFTSARYRIGDSNFNMSDGSPTLTMLSGSLTTEKIILGTANSTVTGILHQVSGSIDTGFINVCDGTQPARLVLDGGTFLTAYVRGSSGSHALQPTKSGFAHILGNGGTIKCKSVNKTYPLIGGLDLAEVGDGGLSIDDNGFSCSVSQSFVDAPGQSGTLTKTGVGTVSLTMPTEYSVSSTRVMGGTLAVLPNGSATAVAMDTSMVVTNGSTLSTVGDTAVLSLSSLDVDGSTLAIDPGDSIVVSGNASFKDVRINFSALPSVEEVQNFLVVSGAVSAASVAAVKSAVLVNPLADGTYRKISCSTEGGAMTFSFEVKNASSLSGETHWQGPGSAWADSANWSDGVPGESAVAMFDDPTATPSVVVSDERDVGALVFGAGAFGMSGAGSLAFAIPGASYVSAAAGSHVVSVGMSESAALPVAVSQGASLELAGAVESEGLLKTGEGRLVLSGANTIVGGVSFAAGMNVVSNASALAGAPSVSVADGTIMFAEGCGSVYPSSTAFALSSTNAMCAVVFDCEDDVTVAAFNPDRGVLVKRGTGTLTLDASAGKIGSLSPSFGNGKNGGGFNNESMQAFADDGTPPAGGFGGLSVAEGELVIKGSGSETLSTVGKILVGMQVASCRAQPVLTLDNVHVSAPTNIYQQHEIGFRCGGACAVTNPVLRLVNGACLDTVGMLMDFQYSAVARWPVIAVTNSTMTASRNSLPLSTVRQSTGFGSFLAANSTFQSDAYSINGCTKSRLTACDVRGYTGEFATLTADRNVAGEVVFDGGTTLRCNGFTMTDYDARYGSALTLAFDGATWIVGDGDLTINDSNMLQTRPKTFEVRNGGLGLVVASGRTLRTSVPFAGCGVLSLTGGGTLAFESGAFAMTGTVAAVSGTVDFSSAGSVSNFTASGSGTFRGATFADGLRIAPTIGDGWTVGAVPLFDGCSFAGRVVVDCGHETGTPLPMCQTPVVVARYSGSAPDVSSWRVTGTGMAHAGGSFTAADGQISMTVSSKGFTIIFR